MPEVYRITEMRDPAGPVFALTRRVGVFTSRDEAAAAMVDAIQKAKAVPAPVPVVEAFDADGVPVPVEG
jgi:hypothetical protein